MRRLGYLDVEAWQNYRLRTGRYLHIYLDGLDVTTRCLSADDIAGYAYLVGEAECRRGAVSIMDGDDQDIDILGLPDPPPDPPPPPPPPRAVAWLSVKDIADEAGVGVAVVYRALMCGDLVGVKTCAGAWRINDDDARRWCHDYRARVSAQAIVPVTARPMRRIGMSREETWRMSCWNAARGGACQRVQRWETPTTCPICEHDLAWNGRSSYCEWCDPMTPVSPRLVTSYDEVFGDLDTFSIGTLDRFYDDQTILYSEAVAGRRSYGQLHAKVNVWGEGNRQRR